jgi:CBS domain containing-hemolysin-like protein
MNKRNMKEISGNLSRSENISISSVMVKISGVTVLNINDSREELKDKVSRSKKTFYPVCEGCKENLIGIIHIKKILISSLSEGKIELKEGLHEPVYFSEDSSISQVYNIFCQSNTGAAFIIDNGNNITGFVTIQDIIKYFLGNLSCKME